MRSAIRSEVQARPTIVASRHFRSADGTTTSFALYTFSHVERCITKGGSRQECRMGGGYGDAAMHELRCLGAGLARVEVGQDTPSVRSRANLPLHADALCSTTLEDLTVADLDHDGSPEVSLQYGWADLRQRESGVATAWEHVERLVTRADLGVQVALRLRARYHPESGAWDDRNRVARLEQTDQNGDGRPDFVLAVTSWSADVCPTPEPPQASRADECELRQSTEAWLYRRATDDWHAADAEHLSPTED